MHKLKLCHPICGAGNGQHPKLMENCPIWALYIVLISLVLGFASSNNCQDYDFIHFHLTYVTVIWGNLPSIHHICSVIIYNVLMFGTWRHSECYDCIAWWLLRNFGGLSLFCLDQILLLALATCNNSHTIGIYTMMHLQFSLFSILIQFWEPGRVCQYGVHGQEASFLLWLNHCTTIPRFVI